MDYSSLWHTLRTILPDVDVVYREIVDILWSDLEEEKKIQKILLTYFKTKTSRSPHDTHSHRTSLEADAEYIHKLFPSVSLNYISNQLLIFRDLPNREEIVLRIIVRDRCSSTPDAQINTKRAVLQTDITDLMNNNQPANAQKLECTATEQTIASAPIESLMPAPERLPLNVKPPINICLTTPQPCSSHENVSFNGILQQQHAITSATNPEYYP